MDRGALATLPDRYWRVPYAAERFPGAVARGDLSRGANCQLWACAVLGHFGFAVPDLRSDELWHDEAATRRVEEPEPLDLVLYNRDHDPYGAHVGLWTGNAVAHLCAEVGRPTVWSPSEFDVRVRYAVRIGFKRPTIPSTL